MSFDIHGIEELNNLMAKLRQIDGVLDIGREPRADKNLDNSAFRCGKCAVSAVIKVCWRYYGRQAFYTRMFENHSRKLYRHKGEALLFMLLKMEESKL